MKIIKPQHLKKGDLIGVISPASTPENLAKIDNGVKYLENLGYRVKVGENVGKQFGYLAGEDDYRVADIHAMFADKEVKAIFCVRGGFGTIRILDKIDYSLIKKNPKILVGYSDITALQLAIFAKTGLVTFSGPMVAVEMSNNIDPYTEEMFWRMITSNKKFGPLKNPEDEKINVLISGNAEGTLIGGNLSMIVCLMGTDYLPKFSNSIFFCEDIDEKPYKIDKYFAQLKLANVFKKANAVVLGEFTDCLETDPAKKTFSLNEVVYQYFSNLNKPVLYNLKYGHIPRKLTMPIGIKFKINTKKEQYEIIENCVD